MDDQRGRRLPLWALASRAVPSRELPPRAVPSGAVSSRAVPYPSPDAALRRRTH